jgi:hypothetical protein
MFDDQLAVGRAAGGERGKHQQHRGLTEFSEMIWDEEAAEEMFDDMPLPEVIWDEEPIHELHAFE